MPGVIHKSYSTIHYDKVKSMFGSKSGGDELVTKSCAASNLLKSNKPNGKGFVEINTEDKEVVFNLTPQRAQNITEVVQFLEKTKHDVSAPVAELRKKDEEDAKKEEDENKNKIAGKPAAKPAQKGKKQAR